MMHNNIKKNYKGNKLSFLDGLIYIVVFLACLDIFYYYFVRCFRGISFYAVLAITVLVVFFQSKEIKMTNIHIKQMLFFNIWAIMYIIVNEFFADYRHVNTIMGIEFNVFTLQVIQVFFIFLLFIFLDLSENHQIKVNIIKIIFISLIIDGLITLSALKIDPNISKVMATGKVELNVYDLKGVSGYHIIYSSVIIMPLLFYSIKTFKSKNRLIILLFTLFMIYFIYKSAYTTALFGLILGILVYVFFNTSKGFKIFIAPLIFCLVIILLNPKLIYNILIYISDKVQIQQISIRLRQLAMLILYDDTSGDSLYRLVLYKRSIDAFLKYPITGITIYDPTYVLSEHSSFLDILGGMGLMGFIPYLLFIFYSYKIAIQKTKDKKLKNAIKTSYILFCFIGFVNPLATSFTIMLFLLFFVTWYIHFDDCINDSYEYN